MTDRMETLGFSRIQHGPHSDRVYLMHLDPRDAVEIPARLEALAARHGYSKIFCKIPGDQVEPFLAAGFLAEATIPTAAGHPGLAFVSRFRTPARAVAGDEREIAEVMTGIKQLRPGPPPALPPEFRLDQASSSDLETLAALYASVFASYPFPIDDPAFLGEAEAEGVTWFVVRDSNGALVAASSIEPCGLAGVVEMTDFATLPTARGGGLGRQLLARMTEVSRTRGDRLAFTIARAGSLGMNRVFAACGYRFAGILVNNTQIGGRLESMNVWYRWLSG